MTNHQKKYIEHKKSMAVLFGAVIGGLMTFMPFILTADYTCRALKGNCDDVWIIIWLIITTLDCFFLSTLLSYVSYKWTCRKMSKLFGGVE